MKSWNEAWWLVRFEVKNSWKYYLYALLTIPLLSFVIFRPLIPEYVENATMGMDFFMVISFSILTAFFRPKHFQSQKMNSIHYSLPFVIALSQQPVAKHTIILYRFIMFFLTMGIFNLLLLICLYPSLQPYMSPTEYLVFSIIWLSFGIYIGGANPATEVRSNLVWSIVFGLFIGFAIFIFYVKAFYSWYESGLVNWTINLAQHHPVASVSLSLLLAVIGIYSWMKVMHYKLNHADFMA